MQLSDGLHLVFREKNSKIHKSFWHSLTSMSQWAILKSQLFIGKLLHVLMASEPACETAILSKYCNTSLLANLRVTAVVRLNPSCHPGSIAKNEQQKKSQLFKFIVHMGVSKKNGTPKSSIWIGVSIVNHPFWGTPIFGKHPYVSSDQIPQAQWGHDPNILSTVQSFFYYIGIARLASRAVAASLLTSKVDKFVSPISNMDTRRHIIPEHGCCFEMFFGVQRLLTAPPRQLAIECSLARMNFWSVAGFFLIYQSPHENHKCSPRKSRQHSFPSPCS